MRGCCTCTTGAPLRRSAAPTAAAMPPQPITSSGSGARTASGTTASGAGHSEAASHFHGRARCEHPHLRLEAGRLGQAQRLRLQSGEALAQNP